MKSLISSFKTTYANIRQRLRGSLALNPRDRALFKSEVLNTSLSRTRLALALLFVVMSVALVYEHFTGIHPFTLNIFRIISLAYIAGCVVFFTMFSIMQRKKSKVRYSTRLHASRACWAVFMLITWVYVYLDFTGSQSLLSYIILTMMLAVMPLMNIPELLMVFLLDMAAALAMALYAGMSLSLVTQIVALSLIAMYAAYLRYSSALSFFREKQRLQHLNRELSYLSETDQLTGLLNRRGLERRIDLVTNYHKRTGQNICLYMIDIDHFKKYNDKFLHLGGDECLQKVANCLKGCARRSTDIVARYGGEEFVMVTMDMQREDALDFALQVKDAVSGLGIFFDYDPQFPVVTISVGVVVSDAPQADANNNQYYAELLEIADKELYNAKNNGRNCVSYMGNVYR